MTRRCDTLRQNETVGAKKAPGAPGLGAPQAKAIGVILRGETVTAAAEKAGVSRATVYRWLRADPAFLDETTFRNRTAPPRKPGGRFLTVPSERRPRGNPLSWTALNRLPEPLHEALFYAPAPAA